MKRFTLFALVFGMGFAVCWLYRDSQTASARQSSSEIPYYLTGGRIKLQKVSAQHDGVGDQIYSLRPVAYNSGDGLKEIQKPSEGTQRWSVSLDGGRVTIFCEERDEPIP